MTAVAIVGNFQIGKSSFVNALMKGNVSQMGSGLATTHKSTSYELSDFVMLFDTPGFNANQSDNDIADSTLKQADFLVYVHENKILEDVELKQLSALVLIGKPILFLLNCTDRNKWEPEDEQNVSISQTIEAQLDSAGILDGFLNIENSIVTPINVLWARFALGLASPEETGQITRYATHSLRLKPEIIAAPQALREQMMTFSCFKTVNDIMLNLPYILLYNAAMNPQREIERFVAVFTHYMAESSLAK